MNTHGTARFGGVLAEDGVSSWTDAARWREYISKEGCPVCNQAEEDRPAGERDIAHLEVSRLIADRDTCLKGHCCLVLKAHAVELFDLSEEDAVAFMRDVRLASRALQKVTGAIKINYEVHGNTIPHIHMHLWPRQVKDRFEDGPIDWRIKDSAVYDEGEFETFVEAMRERVSIEPDMYPQPRPGNQDISA